MAPDITLALQQDHERLDDILEAAAAAVREHRWNEAAALLERFRHGIIDGPWWWRRPCSFPPSSAGRVTWSIP